MQVWVLGITIVIAETVVKLAYVKICFIARSIIKLAIYSN